MEAGSSTTVISVASSVLFLHTHWSQSSKVMDVICWRSDILGTTSSNISSCHPVCFRVHYCPEAPGLYREFIDQHENADIAFQTLEEESATSTEALFVEQYTGYIVPKSWQDGTKKTCKRRSSSYMLAAGRSEPFVCIEEVNNFETWMKDQLLPSLEEPSVIVMDNAPYHSVQLEERRPLSDENGADEQSFSPQTRKKVQDR